MKRTRPPAATAPRKKMLKPARAQIGEAFAKRLAEKESGGIDPEARKLLLANNLKVPAADGYMRVRCHYRALLISFCPAKPVWSAASIQPKRQRG